MAKISFIKTAGVRQRATRRGVRSLDGKFYHHIKDRNAADKAFNEARADREATKQLPGNPLGENKQTFDFEFKEESPEAESTAKITIPKYHCLYCQMPIEFKTPVCPTCGNRMNWEGFE